MNGSIKEHIVEFDKFCDHCIFKDNPEDSIPCDDCLNTPVVADSRQPIEYKPTKEWKQKEKIRKERQLLASKSRLTQKEV